MDNVIAAYKKHGFLYVTQYEWGGIIWRPLGHAEAELYTGLFRVVPKAKAELEDEIFRECVVDHPLPEETFDDWEAGIVTTVAQQILYFSTVKSADEFLRRLEDARAVLSGDIFKELYARVMSLFPGYTLEQLQKMPLDSLFEKVALVELITGEKINLEPAAPQQGPKIPYFPGEIIDFAADNKKLDEVNTAPPKGDWNLDRIRGNS